MVLPAMVYVPNAKELEHHFRTVAQATSLPIMLYNNPPAYRVNIDLSTLKRLAEQSNDCGREGICAGFAPLHPTYSTPFGDRLCSSRVSTTLPWRGFAWVPEVGCPGSPMHFRKSL